nr:MAG TPA: hypothetical protein [Caudoviricetes sp.]
MSISLMNDYGIVAEGMDSEISLESTSAIAGSLLMEYCTPDEISAFLENSSEVELAQNEELLTEKTILKMDKVARLNRAYKTSIFQVAREKKDPLFKKLLTVWKMERFLEGKLEKKYGNEGRRRAKKVVANAGKSKSPLVKKAVSRVKASLNGKK